MKKYLFILMVVAGHCRHGFASTPSSTPTSIIELSGEWEFYWNELKSPTQILAPAAQTINVPIPWNRAFGYPPLGVATYRKTITMPDTVGNYVLYFPVVNSACRVWINGRLLGSVGIVGTQAAHRPQLASLLIPIPFGIHELTIVAEVSNFTHFNGGLVDSPRLGSLASVSSQINRSNSVENFFAGSLVAMFIYQFILFLLFQRGQPHLWLSLICLGVALRAMVVHGGSFMLPNWFPMLQWELWKKIEFFSVYAIIAFFPLYIFHLFRATAARWPVVIFVGLSSLLCSVVCVTPQYLYGQLLDVAHLGLLMSFIFAVYTISYASRRGNGDARIILYGVVASFPFILLEILKNSRFSPLSLHGVYLVEMGVLVFLLFQVYLLALHYARSFRRLEDWNEELERTVSERSLQLIRANQVKDRLLSLLSHDVKSPLNSLKGILQIYNHGAIEAADFKLYAKRIEGDLAKTSLMVDNILYWTTNQLKGVTVNYQQFAPVDLIRENTDLLSTIASNKKITIRNMLPPDELIYFDRDILNITLRNLISNALKFSYEGGTINIVSRSTDTHVVVQVRDYGVGMSSEKIQSLRHSSTTQSSAGTSHEKGTGLGLSFCRDFLEKAGGHLEVESSPGKGSIFSVTMPRREPTPAHTDETNWEHNLVR